MSPDEQNGFVSGKDRPGRGPRRLQLQIENAARALVSRQRNLPASRCLLAGISGIDASGKGYIASKLYDELHSLNLNVAVIKADDWLNLPETRFTSDMSKQGKHFYDHAIRLNEMFDQVVLPLKRNRSIRINAKFVEETASSYRSREIHFSNVDIVMLEGVFIFKRQYVRHFDFSIWVECNPEQALDRAVKRKQENLSESETIKAYESIYFPAQLIHSCIDQPARAADLIINNA